MNTINKGQITLLIFKRLKDKIFTGVCLDFGIVLEGKNVEDLKHQLMEASIGYLETVRKDKLSEELLNNQAEKKYFDLYKKFLKEEKKRIAEITARKAVSQPKPFFNLSRVPVNQLVACYA